MGTFIFITGGCRSGKSTFALELAKKRRGTVSFVATAVGFDREMRERIRSHRQQRPARWRTFEIPAGMPKKLPDICACSDTVIIDCITVYISNLLIRGYSMEKIEEETRRVIRAIRSSPAACIVVSNEVGWGVVPATALGRKFRDLAGGVNKSLAAAADRVYLTVSGIPLKVK